MGLEKAQIDQIAIVGKLGDTDGKNWHIEEAMKQHGINEQDYYSVLIDDNADNIKKAKERGFGIVDVLTDKSNIPPALKRYSEKHLDILDEAIKNPDRFIWNQKTATMQDIYLG
jgi:predicted CoA-binding protein